MQLFCYVAFVLVVGHSAGEMLVSLFLMFLFGVWCAFDLVLFFLFVVWLHCFGSLSFLKNVIGWEHLVICLCHCYWCFHFVILLNTCCCLLFVA